METLEVRHFFEQGGWYLADENVERAKGQSETKDASCSGKQKPLNGKLTDEPGASSSQRTTYRNLSPSAFGPYQQEAGDIDEPDE